MLSDFQYCIQLMLKNQANNKTHPKIFNDKYHDFHCNVCVCVLHQNMKLVLEGSKLPTNQSFRNLFGVSNKEALTYKHLLAIMSCNPPLPECLLGECSVCKDASVDDSCCAASMYTTGCSLMFSFLESMLSLQSKQTRQPSVALFLVSLTSQNTETV